MAKQIIDALPDYKVNKLLYILRGVQIDDDLEDDMFCERLAERYRYCSPPSGAHSNGICLFKVAYGERQMPRPITSLAPVPCSVVHDMV